MDPIVHLRDLVPQPTDLLEMEAEELAGILLAAIQRSGYPQVSRHNTMLAISSNKPQIFDHRVARELPPILAEAWAWLEHECLLIAKPTDPHWQVLSRRAKKITTLANF